MERYEATGIVPVSDSGLVNGAGRFNGGPAVPWSVVNVVQGKRYRLRIINESARNVFTVSIDNHNLSTS
jgi:iron transport multicopper oxidase